MSLARSSIVLLAVAALSACHDEKKFDPTLAVGIDTVVNPGSVTAGEHAQVTCVRVNGRGEPIEGGQFVVGIDPLAQGFVEGMDVFSHTAGTHMITCSDGDSGLIDDSPAELVVRAGPAVTTRISLTPAQIGAGEPSAVVCEALDEHGNVASADLLLTADPDDTVTVTGTTSVTATAIGAYEITCGANGIDVAERAHATLTVVPGARAGITLVFTPELAVYGVFQAVRVQGQPIDAFGNVRSEDALVAVTDIGATPGGAHEITGETADRIRFTAENRYVVSAAAADDTSQTATRPLIVDQTKPVLVIDSPVRGIVTDSLETITVSGTVTDNLGQIDYLRIGGQDMELPLEGGPFSYEIDLQYGLTLLDIRAADTQGFETMTTRGVEQGLGGFIGTTTHTFEADGVTNAAVIVLTQEAFDDNGSEEVAQDDLASIIETILKNLDFASLAPNPLTTFSCIGGDCRLELTSVTMDDANVDMTLKNGAINLDIELIDFEGTMTLWYPCDIAFICPQRPETPLPVTFHADRVNLVTDVMVSVVNNQTQATAANTVVTLEGFTAEMDDSSIVGIIGNGALQGFMALVDDYLVDFIEAFATDFVEDQVGGALDGLFSALALDQTFDIPSFVDGQPPNTLVLQTQANGVDIAPERLQLRVNALAYTQNSVRPHPHLGSLKHTGCAPERAIAFPPPAPILVGLHDDLINELLFAIWDGGTINLNLTGAAADALLADFGLTGATIKVDAMLPPIFESCDGKDKVQLAELNLDIEANLGGATHIGMWMLAEAPFSVEFAPNAEGALEAKLVLAAIDPLHIEVVANTGFFEGNDDGVVSLVKDTIMPQLLGTVTESATFALPAINLGELTGTGAGPVINLDIESVARDNAYLTINGALK